MCKKGNFAEKFWERERRKFANYTSSILRICCCLISKNGFSYLFFICYFYYSIPLTCCAAKRQQSRAPHRELLIKDYGHLKGPYGYWKNWAWWAASPTRWARAGPQSWKIGTFWWTLANFALFWLAHNFPSHQAPCLESPNQLRNLCPIKRFNWGSHFRGPGQKIWNSIFGSETENNHSGRAKFNEK